jgi:hypothetical protein
MTINKKSIITDIEINRKDLSNNASFRFDGYKFTINNNKKEFINIKMENEQDCYEEWYISSKYQDDQMKKFIGAEIIDISYIIQKNIIDEGERFIKVFITLADAGTEEASSKRSKTSKRKTKSKKNKTFKTSKISKNIIPIELYNQHNGYYPHECILSWNLYIDNKLKKEYISVSL